MSRLVLLDRDGTLNVERHYLSSPEQLELLPEAAAGIKLLKSLGLTVVIVSNQSGIGRGYFNLSQLERIHERLRTMLKGCGASVDKIYFCPHAPDAGCECRKPRVEMARRAARDFGANLSESFIVGDKSCDIQLGRNIGATTILVNSVYSSNNEEAQADYNVESLFAAACLIKSIVYEKVISKQ